MRKIERKILLELAANPKNSVARVAAAIGYSLSHTMNTITLLQRTGKVVMREVGRGMYPSIYEVLVSKEQFEELRKEEEGENDI